MAGGLIEMVVSYYFEGYKVPGSYQPVAQTVCSVFVIVFS